MQRFQSHLLIILTWTLVFLSSGCVKWLVPGVTATCSRSAWSGTASQPSSSSWCSSSRWPPLSAVWPTPASGRSETPEWLLSSPSPKFQVPESRPKGLGLGLTLKSHGPPHPTHPIPLSMKECSGQNISPWAWHCWTPGLVSFKFMSGKFQLLPFLGSGGQVHLVPGPHPRDAPHQHRHVRLHRLPRLQEPVSCGWYERAVCTVCKIFV